MEPAEIRSIVLNWLYDRAMISSLPKTENAIMQGLHRDGHEVTLEQLREAIDFLVDLDFAATIKPPLGGGRAKWAWRLTAKGKKAREEDQ